MEQKKAKADMFAKFQKKAGEKDKAAKKPDKDVGNSVTESPRDAEDVYVSKDSSLSDDRAKASVHAADPGPASSKSTDRKPVEAPAPSQPPPNATATPNKLNRWLSKASSSAAGVTSPPEKSGSVTPRAEAPSTPQPSVPPAGPVAPAAAGSKPIFGTPFQGIDDGSGWLADSVSFLFLRVLP